MTTLSIPRVLMVDVVVPASTVTATTFDVATVTGGLRVASSAIYVGTALGASVTLSLGDTGGSTGSPTATAVAASATRYISAGDGNTVAKLSQTDTVAGQVGFTIPNSGTTVQLKTGGATTTATARTVTVTMTLVEAY